MEIRQLEALNAIVTSGSVTAAGRMLGRSQPVVSRQISDLEAELGFLLFTRTRPTITLTEQGAEFYQEVRGILAELHQLESRVQGMRNGQVRPLRVLAAVDLARGLLPEALARMDRFSPVFREKLIIEEVVHEVPASALAEGRADFALINLPIDAGALRVHWCGQAPCLLAMPAAHPLAARETVRLEDVRNTDVITLLNRYRMRYHLTSSLVQATAGGARRHIEVGSQQTALSLVRLGLGVALIDPFSIRGVHLDGIVLRPIQTDIAYMIGAVSQATHELSEGAQRLVQGLHLHVQSCIPHYVDTDPSGLRPRASRKAEVLRSA
ncbi:LysR family transcriptional regulator [Castellaniella daejeonensis]|jgi:DNA-binding transcriptional LysR family regulator|uniref:LysR family transcriptional regulator n=1 Tax=Castellaniella daejeonensis TaxID=659013 RepID=A0ABN0TXT4_9BURK|nr:LysR family transcriptional regulator [Castellaniella sp.]HET8702994.1 LysR family transcriptional regulator [Castellaniella sp.]